MGGGSKGELGKVGGWGKGEGGGWKWGEEGVAG